MRVVIVQDLQYHNYLHWAPLSKHEQFLFKKKETWKICRRDSKHFLLSNIKGNIFFLEKIYRPMKNLKN
jgi:hypothetical protein